MVTEKPVLYTVGHSTHSIEHFIDLLKRHRIQAIADVRSHPYSRRNPQFNRETLQEALNKEGISYVFLGRELGARRDEPASYRDNKVDYGLVAQTTAFRQGVDRLEAGAQKMRVAIMCAEKDPVTCHRTVLVAHFARERFSGVQHILADGSVETGEGADKRLLNAHGLNHSDLFTSDEERINLAYIRQAKKIAFEENPEARATHG